MAQRGRADDLQVRDLLRHFRTHLFDRTLEVTEAYKACGIPAKNFPPLFRSIARENPQEYLIARRLEVGCKLLAHTGIHIYEVGLLSGYATGQAFSLGFKRAKGMRPKSYRTKYQNVENSADLDKNLREQVRRFDPKEAQAFRVFLYSEHPDLLSDKPSLRYQLGEGTYSPSTYGVSESAVVLHSFFPE